MVSCILVHEGRLPKKLAWDLRKTRPGHETKRKWRDLVTIWSQ